MSTNASTTTKTGTDSSSEKRDPAKVVTELLIAELEQGTVPWRKPWTSLGRPQANLKSKRAYRGINALILALSPYSQPWWLSFRQAHDLGGSVRKGERSRPVLFWKTFVKALPAKEPGAFWNEEKNQWERTIWMSRYYRIFNVEQCDGLEGKIPESPQLTAPEPEAAAATLVAAFEAYCDRESIVVRHGGDRAGYIPLQDTIVLPTLEQFHSHIDYAMTAAHEGVHSTGAQKRLDRPGITGLTTATWGDATYSKEELIAEIGAAMLAATLGISVDIESSAAYIDGWLRVLKNDRQMIISAAQRAQDACDLMRDNADDDDNVDVAESTSTSPNATAELAIA